MTTAWLHEVIAELDAEAKVFARQMDAFALKRAHFLSVNESRMRTFDDKARKGGPW